MMSNLLDRWLGGHIHFGPVTIYGRNAMHWGVNIHTRRWGYVCFRLPFTCYGKWWPLYFYVSPNATPWASTFLWGGDGDHSPRMARARRDAFGHNFDTDDPELNDRLMRINGYERSRGPIR